MAAEPFNSIAGYSVGIPPVPVIDSTCNLTINVQYPSGNVVVNTVTANNFSYANGSPLISGSGASGFSGYSGDNPGSSGFSGTSGYSGDNPGSSCFSGTSGY